MSPELELHLNTFSKKAAKRAQDSSANNALRFCVTINYSTEKIVGAIRERTFLSAFSFVFMWLYN
jgi:hypothetical protein